MTEKKQDQQQQINLNSRIAPVYADRTLTANQVAHAKVKRGSGKKTEDLKEGTIRVFFIDSVTQSTVADVVMTSIAAEQLAQGLRTSVKKLHEEIAKPIKKSTAKKPKKVDLKNETTTFESSYIG